MSEIIKPPVDTYFIVMSNDESVIRYGICPASQVMQSGLPVMETFLTEEDWLIRLLELGIVPETE